MSRRIGSFQRRGNDRRRVWAGFPGYAAALVVALEAAERRGDEVEAVALWGLWGEGYLRSRYAAHVRMLRATRRRRRGSMLMRATAIYHLR